MTGKGMSEFAFWMIIFGVVYYATSPIWYPIKRYHQWRDRNNSSPK
jgi:hypothetical protein